MNLSDTDNNLLRQSSGDKLHAIRALPRVAMNIHAESQPIVRLFKASRFCLKSLRALSNYASFKSVFNTPELAEIIRLCPDILEKAHSPYVCIEWDSAQRYRKLNQHFEVVQHLFAERAVQIYKPDGFKLFEFEGQVDDRYTVELFPGYQNEGALGIRIRDANEREVYALSFHLGQEPENVCYIGALQGPNDRIPERQKTIISITRGLHGLRPKALMLEVLYMIASSLDIKHLYGVSNSGSIYPLGKHGNKQSLVSFDRDAMWREYRASQCDGGLFQFPEAPVRKQISSLKSTKRSLYRKRYAWLERATEDTHAAMAKLIDAELSEGRDAVTRRAA